jgi:membrane-associated phospholipid phosphatase
MRKRRVRRFGPPGIAPVPLALGALSLATARWRRLLNLQPRSVLALSAAGPALVAAGVAPGKTRSVATWAAQMWAYKIAFEAPIDRRAALRARLHVDYPIVFDSMIAGGTPPGRRLQTALRRPPRITVADRLIAFSYALWEIEPHAALLWLLLRRPERFARAAGRLGATFDLTLLGYWLIPTAPPWWASEKLGRMNGDVHRVVIEVKRELRGEPRPVSEHEVGANPWAAMPSDHFATALMTALLLLEADRRLGAAALGYAATLGFALVYLGEHYVLDLLAGASLAALVYTTEPLIRPAACRLAERWAHGG